LTYELIVGVAALAAGAIAAVSGFGVGSLLTPVLALQHGTRVAVALVAVPHVVGTAVRLAALWRQVDRQVLLRFGALSAAGGLLGALLNARLGNAALTLVFAALLLLAGVLSLTGLTERVRLEGWAAWAAGAVSGVFGGLVGNQGGIRAAALLGFDLRKESFVATATAVALVIDGARLPVYLATQGREIREAWATVAVAVVGVLAGTLGGVPLLRRIPDAAYRRIVGVLLLLLGAYMMLRGLLATGT
jgi:uncharacterized membrane protein YfcA